MGSTTRAVLVVVGTICFGLAAFNVPSGPVSWVGLGLFCFALTQTLPLIHE